MGGEVKYDRYVYYKMFVKNDEIRNMEQLEERVHHELQKNLEILINENVFDKEEFLYCSDIKQSLNKT